MNCAIDSINNLPMICQFVYCPGKIFSHIQILYTTKEALYKNSNSIESSYIQYVSNDFMDYPVAISELSVKNLIYVTCDDIITIYHCNENMTSTNIIGLKFNIYSTFVKNYSYFGFLIDNFTKYIPIDMYLDEMLKYTNNAENFFISGYGNLYDIDNNCMIKPVEDTNNVLSAHSTSDEIINDLLFMSSHGGLVLINPTSYLMYISCIIMSSHNYKNIYELLNISFDKRYFMNMKVMIHNLLFDINSIKNRDPLREYVDVYALLHEHDPDYSFVAHTQLQSNIVNIFKGINISDNESKYLLNDILTGFKHDLCMELNNIYHRFRIFPHERKIMYSEFSDNPYILLVKKIHNELFVDQSIKITYSNIYNYLMTRNNYATHNELAYLMYDAVKLRHKLFTRMHEIFVLTKKNNIKPKYKYQKYFPLRVFSSSLFLLEHLLNTYN